MNYADWLKTVPVEIREDPLWNQEETVLENVPIPGTELTEHGTRNTEHATWNPSPALAIVATLLLVTSSSALDWPQLRGPAGNGCAPQADPPVTWSETNNIAWKVRVTGRGRSSPIILGEHIWLTTAVEQGVVRTNIR